MIGVSSVVPPASSFAQDSTNAVAFVDGHRAVEVLDARREPVHAFVEGERHLLRDTPEADVRFGGHLVAVDEQLGAVVPRAGEPVVAALAGGDDELAVGREQPVEADPRRQRRDAVARADPVGVVVGEVLRKPVVRVRRCGRAGLVERGGVRQRRHVVGAGSRAEVAGRG
jgi:hypothetical protein